MGTDPCVRSRSVPVPRTARASPLRPRVTMMTTLPGERASATSTAGHTGWADHVRILLAGSVLDPGGHVSMFHKGCDRDPVRFEVRRDSCQLVSRLGRATLVSHSHEQEACCWHA